MTINVFSYQVRNGKKYDLVEINETIEEKELPQLLKEYRKKIKSKETVINDKIHYDPDIHFFYKEVNKREKVRENPKERPYSAFKPTTKSTKELIVFS